MEYKDVFNASENYVKVEINEEQWWQEDISSEMKCKSEELPISELQNENVFCSSDTVTESKSNVTSRDDHNMDLKMEIKEEFSDDTTSFFPNINSRKNSYNDSNTTSIDSNQPQKFILPSGAKTYSSTENCKMPHKCEICGKSFELLSALRLHSVKHEDKKLSEIDEKQYAEESNRKHEEKRSHTCEVCNKSFTRLSHLKCHILIHEGKRLHTCTVCNKTFTQTSHLKRHTLIHEGKKPHKCEICQRAFIHKSALKQHELTHEGIRPHTCEICDKRYTHMTTLKRHKLNHEGKRPYTCEICKKSFIQSSSLKEHKLIHKGKKPHICEICNKNFSNNSNLTRHKLTHEGKNT